MLERGQREVRQPRAPTAGDRPPLATNGELLTACPLPAKCGGPSSRESWEATGHQEGGRPKPTGTARGLLVSFSEASRTLVQLQPGRTRVADRRISERVFTQTLKDFEVR